MKNKTITLIVIALSILLLAAFLGREYNQFTKYSSSTVKKRIGYWLYSMDRYYQTHITVPEPNQLLDFIKNDSVAFKDIFPKVYAITNKLNMNDFVFMEKQGFVVDVWMFSEHSETKDTLHFSEMNFIDYLLKRSVYVTTIPLAHPCGSEAFILLNDDNNRIENPSILMDFRKTRRQVQQKANQLKNYELLRGTCYHLYKKDGDLVTEEIYSDKKQVDPELQEIILEYYKGVFTKYHHESLELYFYLY